MDGYKPKEKTLEYYENNILPLNVLWGIIGAPIVLLVDFANGTAWDYEDNVFIKLEPLPKGGADKSYNM